MKTSNRTEKLKYWQAINNAYEGSGLSIRAFCLSQNITYKNFLNYRYRTKQSSATNSSLFIPVEIKANHQDTQTNVMVNTSSLILMLRGNIQLQIPVEVVSKNLLHTVFNALEVL